MLTRLYPSEFHKSIMCIEQDISLDYIPPFIIDGQLL